MSPSASSRISSFLAIREAGKFTVASDVGVGAAEADGVMMRGSVSEQEVHPTKGLGQGLHLQVVDSWAVRLERVGQGGNRCLPGERWLW